MNWINQMGDRTPQFLRECHSRFTARSVFAAVGLTLVAIALLLLSAWSEVTTYPERFCAAKVVECTIQGVQWSKWWLGIFRTVTWTTPYIAIGLGMFLLIGDLQREEQLGTLNFLRLSPRSSWGILLGKLFGVPILVYLALAIALPFQWVVGLLAQVPVSLLISYAFYLGLDLFCFYSVALLAGLLGARTARQLGQNLTAGTLALSIPLLSLSFLPVFLSYRLETVWKPFSRILQTYPTGTSSLAWFKLPIGQQFGWATAVGLLQTGVFLALVWWVLHRCYQTPQNTVISKIQSYAIAGAAQINLLGYLISVSINQRSSLTGIWIALMFVNWVLFSVIISNLTPHRQLLIDWMRSRKQPLIRDLLIGEQSPVNLAIAINLLLFSISALPLLIQSTKQTWIDVQGAIGYGSNVALLLSLGFSLMMVYASLIQLLLSARNSKRGVWAVGILAFLILVPLICSWIVMIGDSSRILGRLLLLITPFSPTALIADEYFLGGIALGWVVVGLEWGIALALMYLLARRLQTFARS